MKIIPFVFIISVALFSCSKEPVVPIANFSFEGGVFLLNEGNFRGGNGSLSFFSYDSTKIYNNLFYNANGRPLGDVPNSLTLTEDKLYIVVNNSGKIEVVDNLSLQSRATITGLISPRNMTIINDKKAYVSSIYSDSIAIINLPGNSISGYINIRRSSEDILVARNKAYISNWLGGKEIMVVDIINDRLIDSIQVGSEPESMVLDYYGNLWVLCNGGWQREKNAEIDVINTNFDFVDKKFEFPTLQNSPSCLQTDGAGLTILYLDKGVHAMDITAGGLPAEPLIPEEDSHFYKLKINPLNGDIFVTDAVDYMQKGYLMLYKNNGKFVLKQQADIIPGSMCFKLNINTQTI